MGVAYNPETFNVAVMVQGKMSQIRANSKGDFYDQILFLLDQQGDVDTALTVTQGSLAYDMYSAPHGIFNKRGTYQDEHYYYAGWSYGFQTKYQKLDPTSYPEVKDSAVFWDYDTYVYYADFNEADSNNCLYQEEVSSSDARRRLDKTSQSAIDNTASSFEVGLTKIVSLFKSNNDIPKELKQNYFIPYVSRYSGGFDLLDTMKIPRPCAFESYNLTSVDYYRGQNTKLYDIGE